jgi:hypothetical protein
MDTPKMLMLVIVAIGLLYVLLPIVAYSYLAFRGRRSVTCPATGLPEEIELDAWHAAVTAVPGPPGLHVVACTGWPARARCGEGCVRGATAAPPSATIAS